MPTAREIQLLDIVSELLEERSRLRDLLSRSVPDLSDLAKDLRTALESKPSGSRLVQSKFEGKLKSVAQPTFVAALAELELLSLVKLDENGWRKS